MTRILPYTLLIVGTAAFMSIQLTTSCQPFELRTELQKIDSLKLWLEEAEENFAVEEIDIQERHDSIWTQLDFIGEHKARISREEQMVLTDFRSIGRAYRHYLENYEVVRFDQNAHEERISNLEKDLRAGRIDKDEFKEIYQEERKIISSHRASARDLGSTIASVEKTYQRTKPKVRDMYMQSLAQK